MESCLALAGAMARQWFGVLMQPAAPEDAWVMEGLAAYLEDVFARAVMGQVRGCREGGKAGGMHGGHACAYAPPWALGTRRV